MKKVNLSTVINDFFNRIWVLIWKNSIFRIRFWFLSIFEIICPVFFLVLILIIKKVSDIKIEVIEESRNTIEPLNDIYSCKIFYTPPNPFTNEIIDEIAKSMKFYQSPNSFNSENELIISLTNENNTKRIGNLGIVFLGESASNDISSIKLPTKLEYKIRDEFCSTKYKYKEFKSKHKDYTYCSQCFVTIQNAINKLFIKKHSNQTYDILIQYRPFPKYTYDSFSDVILRMDIFKMFLVGFQIMVARLINNILNEKQSGIKELQKMMGIGSSFLWLGWYFNTMMIVLIVIILMTILLCSPIVGEHAILNNSNSLIIFISLFLFVTAAIVFIFFLSTLFQKPIFATIILLLIWNILLYVPLTVFWSKESYWNALFFIKAIMMIFECLLEMEQHNLGIHWCDLPKKINGVSIGGVWLMLILDIFLGAILTWYFDQVYPGNFGVAKPWYFPFEPILGKRYFYVVASQSNETQSSDAGFEEVPPDLKPGIEISGVRKVFGRKVAVDGVNLTIYQNEITALLGHNGAGKTTLMSMITGLYPTTQGSIRIQGRNVATDLVEIRKSLGLCPQVNMHFDEFTVLEHFLFFAMIKGNSRKEAAEECDMLLKILNIEAKRNSRAKSLSGGMKRKLSLGIALIGHSKIVILDEPTSGMDPQSRRSIWNHLLSMRGQRTILLTTHFMEEADVLGDRIAIMGQGKVRCSGTPIYLKRKFGSGYQLKMLYSSPNQVNMITNLITSHIREAQLESSYRSLLTYSLPITATSKFPLLFEQLTQQKNNLNIDSIGIALSTLEDVFLRLESPVDKSKNQNGATIIDIDDTTPRKNLSNNGHHSIFFQRFRALLNKKLIYTRRRYYLLLIEILCPLLVLIYCLYLGRSTKTPEEMLTFSLNIYPKTEILLENDDATFKSFFMKLTKPSSAKIHSVSENITNAFLEVAYKNLQIYDNHYNLGGVMNFIDKEIIVIFDSYTIHMLPIGIDLFSNAILKYLMNSTEYSIKTINHPYETRNFYYTDANSHVVWMVLMPVAMLLVLTVIIQFPLQERITSSKQIQYMAGVSPGLYWFINFFVDFFIYICLLVLMVLTIVIYDRGNQYTSIELNIFILILILYGLSGIWFSYFVSFFTKTPSGSLNFLFLFNIISGLIYPISVLLITFWKKKVGNFMQYVFFFSPQYSLSLALLKLIYNLEKNLECNSLDKQTKDNICLYGYDKRCCLCPVDCRQLSSYISNKGEFTIWNELFFLLFDFFFYLILVYLIETGILKKIHERILMKLWALSLPNDLTLDDDVQKEQKLTENELLKHQRETTATPTSTLLVNQIVKQYGRNMLAVKRVSFRVSRGECFGLLGVNGAGKTSTFKILTGEEVPTSGDAKLDQYFLSQQKNKYMSSIGYCPQFDPINEVLTGRETLTFYSEILGKTKEQVKTDVDKLIKSLGLTQYQDALCGTYSGGNKRKLSAAIALISQPEIVFLDEPTSGVDPVSRRNLWNMVESTKRIGKSLVLTSHSMEECEALCDRLAIMVNGQLKCIGPNQYLKEKFNLGYNIQLKMTTYANEISIADVKCAFENVFAGKYTLKDEHKTLLEYELNGSDISLSHVFRALEELKEQHAVTIEDYSLSQSSLEQLFLSFATGKFSN